MSWQECPVCKGSGIDPHVRVASTGAPLCPTCKGSRIISKETGEPK